MTTQTQRIANKLNESMAKYTSSLQPTDDEVSIAWLLTEISRLEGKSDVNCKRCTHHEICIHSDLIEMMATKMMCAIANANDNKETPTFNADTDELKAFALSCTARNCRHFDSHVTYEAKEA